MSEMFGMFKQRIQLPQQVNSEQLTSGILGLHDNISPASRRLGFLSVAKNLQRTGVTAASTRPGRKKVGENLSSEDAVISLAKFYKSDGTRQLIAGAGKTWKVYDAEVDTWDTLASNMAEKPFNAATFNDLAIITNGEDNVKKYDGSTLSDIAGAPKSPYIATAYHRVFLVEKPHLLRVSDVADAEGWSGGDEAAIPINDKDGDEITWVRLYRTNVYIWKRYGLFELHGPEVGYFTKDWQVVNVAPVGTPNGRTIAEVGGNLYWLSDAEDAKGIVAWSGGRPQLISEPIAGLISKIDFTNIEGACATTDGRGSYILSVPLLDNTTKIIVFNSTDNSWWLWENWQPRVFTSFRFPDRDVIVMGDADGAVYELGGLDDNGTPIEFSLVVGPSTLGLNTKNKRVRRTYIVLSLDGELTAAVSNSDTGLYGNEVEIKTKGSIERVTKYLPLNQGEPAGGFIYSLQARGKGQVTFYELGFDISARGV